MYEVEISLDHSCNKFQLRMQIQSQRTMSSTTLYFIAVFAIDTCAYVCFRCASFDFTLLELVLCHVCNFYQDSIIRIDKRRNFQIILLEHKNTYNIMLVRKGFGFEISLLLSCIENATEKVVFIVNQHNKNISDQCFTSNFLPSIIYNQ